MRVLVLCTGNSARSQIAEALFNHRGGGRFRAESAGSHPAARVHPLAVKVLAEYGIAWEGRTPRSMAGLERQSWDLVITVCDNAKEVCPFFPGARMLHWGMPDPADVDGDDERRLDAFRATYRALERRIAEFTP